MFFFPYLTNQDIKMDYLIDNYGLEILLED